MNKRDFIEHLAVKLAVPASEAEKLLNGFIQLIYERLQEGDEINISGFGQFYLHKRKPSMGINPRQPGTKVPVPSMTLPKFKPGTTFKTAVRDVKVSPSKKASPTPIQARQPEFQLLPSHVSVS